MKHLVFFVIAIAVGLVLSRWNQPARPPGKGTWLPNIAEAAPSSTPQMQAKE